MQGKIYKNKLNTSSVNNNSHLKTDISSIHPLTNYQLNNN